MSCTPTLLAEIHVGDVGTQYRVKLTDTSVCDLSEPFDPTAASSKQLIFGFPSGAVAVDADMLQVDDDWYLTYTVLDDDFHAAPGKFSLQAVIEFGDGQVYHSSIRKTDDCGHELRLWPNLETGSGSP